MKFNNSQDDWEIDLSKNITDIGIKISGGADSAIVAYMLALYVTQERPDITIHPITAIADTKAYQYIYACSVLQKVEELTGIVFAKHQYTTVDAKNDYVTGQERFLKSLYDQQLFSVHFAGITANPTIQEAPELYIDVEGMPSDDRSKQLIKHKNYRLPLINIDKQGVAEHYTRLGVMEELFPITRSCEATTTDFSKHCEECWFCSERHWGFGRYV